MDRPVALGVIIVGLAALSLQALAQTPAAPAVTAPGSAAAAPAGPTTLPSIDIPRDTKSSATPDTDAKTIDAFININVQNLMSDNPGAQQIGRDKLDRAIAGVGSSNAPSPAFVNYYVLRLSKALEPAIRSKNVRTRLNAAIVVFRVTMRASDTQLQNLALLLMKDKTDAVALWGVKSAGAMISLLVANNSAANNPMIKAISPTVAEHKSSAVAQEAYQALSLGAPDIKISLTGAGPVIDEILNTLQGRVRGYVAGIPEDPASDRLAVTFLTSEKIQGVLTPAQKTRAMQLIADLAELAAGQFANATTRPDKEQLAYIVSFSAKGLLVSAVSTKGDALDDALTKLSKTNVNSNPAQVLVDAKAMFAQLQKKYPELKAAPAIAIATTAPATAPGAVAPAAPAAPAR